MKAFVFVILILGIVEICSAQITTKKVIPFAPKTVESGHFDGTRNFLGPDVGQYIGEGLYLNGVAESLQQYEYRGFSEDLNNPSYDKWDYEKIFGHYFTVLDVIKDPRADRNDSLYGNGYFLKLQDKSDQSIIYFLYDTRFESSFPFIAVKYFEHVKKKFPGKEYIVRGKNWISDKDPMTDMATGTPVVEFAPGKRWKCVDVTIEDRYYNLSLILENSKGQQIPFSVSDLKDNYFVFPKVIADKVIAKNGRSTWHMIVNGKVKVGMSKELCLLSWNEPKTINKTIVAGGTTEQWVYEENYLYFKNDILTAIQ